MHCHPFRHCTLCSLHTAHLTWREIFLSLVGRQSHSVSPRISSLTHRHTEQGILLISASPMQLPLCAHSHTQSLPVCTYLHPQHTHPLSKQACGQTCTHTHTHHPQEELQVLRGNPSGSESLVNGIINFLMSTNITQRQPPEYGGTFPANIHTIRIFGFTLPQLLLSAVLTAAKLSLLR